MAEQSIWDKLAAMMSGGTVGQNQVPQTPMGSTPIELAMLNAPPRPPVPEPFALPETGIPQAPPQVVTQQAALLSKVPPAPVVEPGMARSRIGYNIPGPSANTQALLDQLEGKGLESLKAQGLTVEALKKQLEAAGKKETPWNLQPLAALVDTWTGSRLAPSMAPQITDQTIAAEKERLQNALLKAQQGMSDDELAMLKNKLSTQLGIEQMAASEREKAASNATQLEAARIAAGGRETVRNDEKFEKNIQELAKRGGDSVAPIASQLQKIDEIFSRTNGKLSGIGGIESMKPDFMLTQDGQDLRQLGGSLLANIVRMYSGTAASDREIERLKKSLGTSWTNTPDQYVRGVQNIRDFVAAKQGQSVESGFKPDVVAEYEKRGGITSKAIKKIPLTLGGGPRTAAASQDDIAAAAAELARRGVK